MARIYTCVFSAVAVTAAQDLFALVAATDKPIRLLGWHLGQHSDAGDAQDEMLQIRVRRGQTTVGSGGGAVTPQLVEPYQGAAAFTVRINDTTIASAGTIVNLYSGAFNVRAGDLVMLPEGLQFGTDATTGRLTLELVSTPADSLTMDGTILVMEF